MLLAIGSKRSYARGMHLREYLALDDHLPVALIRQRMNELGADVKDDAQIRQWVAAHPDGSFKRQPGAGYAMYLELATDGKVTRRCMRPDDYRAIWPELDERNPVEQKAGA